MEKDNNLEIKKYMAENIFKNDLMNFETEFSSDFLLNSGFDLLQNEEILKPTQKQVLAKNSFDNFMNTEPFTTFLIF